MRTLYFDCQMGAAGDMLTAALLELIPEPEQFVEKFNALGIPGVIMQAEPTVKCGIRGTHVAITVNGEEEESADHVHGHTQEHDHDHEHEHHGHSHGQEEKEHTHVHDGHAYTHTHSTLSGIEHIIKDHLDLPENVQEDVLAVYQAAYDRYMK